MRRALMPVLVAALALAACGSGSDGENTANGSTHTVTKGPLRITLTEKGTLRAKNSVQIRPKIRGQAKVLELIEEGTAVEEGEVLVVLDKTTLEKDVASLTDQVDQLGADVKSATTDVEIQISDNKSSIEKAQLEMEMAQRDLERYEKGDARQELRQRDLRVDTAKSDLERAKQAAEETPELLRLGFLTPLQAEEEQLKIRKLGNELESAKLDLELWHQYEHPMEMKRRTSRLEETKRGLERAKKLAESRLTSKQVVESQKKRRLAATQQKLADATEQLENMVIKAPGPGIVVFEQGRRYDSETIKIGDTAYPGRVLMTLPDLSEMLVELEIHEADIKKLKRDQQAQITLESERNLILGGTVTRVATVGTSRGRWDSVKKFSITVEIREKDLDWKPGMSAQVEILIEEIPDTLSVPIQAVFATQGEFFCWVLDGGDPVRTVVKPGRSNDNFVQIVEGLSDGDVVLLYDPSGGEDAGETGNGSPE